jgi:hypothetical protein
MNEMLQVLAVWLFMVAVWVICFAVIYGSVFMGARTPFF